MIKDDLTDRTQNLVVRHDLSGERTRLACWRWRRAIADFIRLLPISFAIARPNSYHRRRKFVAARRRNQHARRVRSPES